MHPTLLRIAEALERLAPPPAPPPAPEGADAFLWHPDRDGVLAPVAQVARLPLAHLHGIDQARDVLLSNTRRFAQGLPANNAMLWGARGMGKSSLVKAVHAEILHELPGSLALIEIARDDIGSLPKLLAALRKSPRRCLVFCDDLSFEREDSDYKALKSVLDGGIAGRPANVLFYATSNRRHLLRREAIENEQGSALNPGEVIEEKLSLSDRFGLWLGFHACDQAAYLRMVETYAEAWGLEIAPEALREAALTWSRIRGARSGRVAYQFALDQAAREGKTEP